MSQAALANILNLTRNRVASYEYNQARPSLEVLRRYSDHFGVSIDDLINRNLADERELLTSKRRLVENGGRPPGIQESKPVTEQVFNLNEEVVNDFVNRNRQIEKMVQGFKAFRQMRRNDDSGLAQKEDNTIGTDNLVYLLEHLIETNKNLINSMQHKS